MVAGVTSAPNRQVLTHVTPRAQTGDVAWKLFHELTGPDRTHRPFIADGTSRTTLPLWSLPHRSPHMQHLRPRPTLLRQRLCAASACLLLACRRATLSEQLAWSSRSRRSPTALPRPASESDASGFPTSGPTCSTADKPNAVCRNHIAAGLALPFL